MWNRLLIFFGLRPDFVNDPDFSPPAFDEAPHVYDPELYGKTLTYCALCGGGPKHSIHISVRPPYAATADANASKAEGMEV